MNFHQTLFKKYGRAQLNLVNVFFVYNKESYRVFGVAETGLSYKSKHARGLSVNRLYDYYLVDVEAIRGVNGVTVKYHLKLLG